MIFSLVITKKDPVVTMRDGGKIRCPKCAWEPSKESRWYCAGTPDACGHCWNTFDTRGVCPGCDKRWTETACLHCHAWSLHEDWYVRDGDE